MIKFGAGAVYGRGKAPSHGRELSRVIRVSIMEQFFQLATGTVDVELRLEVRNIDTRNKCQS